MRMIIIKILYMSQVDKNAAKNINKLYENRTFSESYGGDIWISAIIVLVLLILIGYYTLLNAIKPLRRNWSSVRCSPSIMPFAGMIVKEPGMNFTESTKFNAQYCTNQVVDKISGTVTNPITKAMGALTSTMNLIGKAADGLIGILSALRQFIMSLVESIMLKISVFIIPLVTFIYNIKDAFQKMSGIFVTAVYTGLTIFMMFLSSLGAIPIAIGIMIAALYVVGFGLIASFFLSALGFPIVLTATIFLGLLVVYLVYIQPLVEEGVNVDWCFYPNTKVKLKNGKIYKMKDIPLNSILKNGATVQAVMDISNINEKGEQKEEMYSISGGENNENIIVSGKHLIYDKNTKSFIRVHTMNLTENITKITDTKHETLCCLITSDHTIPIGKHIFHDWEDNNGSPAKNL
jgi:hypothetical protein